MVEYESHLAAIVRDHPHLGHCVVRCHSCDASFLTHPCNQGRADIRCPFGCREYHRRRESARRSLDYYRSAEGREKKRVANARRSQKQDGSPIVEDSPPVADAAIISYLRMAIGLIERRFVDDTEVIELLGHVLRQHRLDLPSNIKQGGPPRCSGPP